MSAGKGDKPRPVDKSKYNSNYDAINWSKKSDSSRGQDANGGEAKNN
jgi:hypothetical protein